MPYNPFVPARSSIDPSMYLAADEELMTPKQETEDSLMRYIQAQGIQMDTQAPAQPDAPLSIDAETSISPDVAKAGIGSAASLVTNLGSTLAKTERDRQQMMQDVRSQEARSRQSAIQRTGLDKFQNIADLIATYRAAL